jgi:non-specific serine/threonine protein kinase/serine/threonine-protein kinase
VADDPDVPPDDKTPRGPETDETVTGDGVPRRPGSWSAGRPPSRIGPYRLVRKLGEGGMGMVYEAEQEEPIRRRVAIKLIKIGMDTASVIARFDAERQALAVMNHPSIAKVLDAGATEDGRPYFVMEFVEGGPLTRWCDEARSSMRERLDLFVQICDGVHHAHQKGIIHRDLKPSNVLVEVRDGKPVPKIIDFGIARATTRSLTAEEHFTQYGQIIGTPEYMSPEQAETGIDVDTRTDVYALGVVLYELLTGALPFDPRALRRAGYDEIRRMIREEQPSRPSARITSLGGGARELADQRHTDVGHLLREVRGDLDWITMKALAKERGRRYPSASEFAADVLRHLRSEPVVAGPPSVVYRTRKFVRRHRFGVSAAAVVLLCLVVGVLGTTYGMIRALRAEKQARIEAATATRVSEFLEGLFEVSDPGEARGNSVTAREILDRGVESIRRELREEPETRARLLETLGRVYRKLGLYKEARPLLEESVSLTDGTPGVSATDEAEALDSLAALLLDMRLPAEALPIAERALAFRESNLPADGAGLGRSLNNLGAALWEIGRTGQARVVWERALVVRESALGPDHPEVAKVLSNLAVLDKAQGKVEQSAARLERALAIVEKRLGADHPQTASVLNNLANAYRRLDRFDEALAALRKALTIQRTIYPGDHAKTASTLNALGLMYGERGQVTEGIEACEQALAMRERIFGAEHNETKKSIRALVDLYSRAGRTDEANALIARLK